MTIDQTVSWLAWTLVLSGLVLGAIAVRRVILAGRLRYYLLRREQAAGAWRLLLVGAAVIVASIVVFAFGRPAAYVVFPPTPSVTATATTTYADDHPDADDHRHAEHLGDALGHPHTDRLGHAAAPGVASLALPG